MTVLLPGRDMLLWLMLSAALFPPITMATAQQSVNAKLCIQSHLVKLPDFPSDDAMIKACTALIRSKQTTDIQILDAYSYRGSAYRSKGDAEGEIANFTELLKINPYLGYTFRSSAYENLKKYDLAIEDYTKALEITCSRKYGSCDQAYSHRSSLFMELKNYPRAIADASIAIAKADDKNKGDYYRSRAYIYMEIKDYKQAIADYKQSTCCHFELGSAHALDGEFKDAVAAFTKAIDEVPDRFDAYFSRGEAYEASGDFRNALIDIRTALNIYKKIHDNSEIDEFQKTASISLKRVEDKLSPPVRQPATPQASASTAKKPAEKLDCNDPTAIKTADDFYACVQTLEAKAIRPAPANPPGETAMSSSTDDSFISKGKLAVNEQIKDVAAQVENVRLKNVEGKRVACGTVYILDPLGKWTGRYPFAYDGQEAYIKVATAGFPNKSEIDAIILAALSERRKAYDRLCN